MPEPLDNQIYKSADDKVSVLLVGGPMDGAALFRSEKEPIFTVFGYRDHYQLLKYRAITGERDFFIYAAMPCYWNGDNLETVSDILAIQLVKLLAKQTPAKKVSRHRLSLQFLEEEWNTL